MHAQLLHLFVTKKTTVVNRGWDAGVGACASQAKQTTGNKVCVRQAEVGGTLGLCQGEPLRGGSSGHCACGRGELVDRHIEQC